MKTYFPHALGILFSIILISCGTSIKTFSTDPKSVDHIMRESEDRIAKITLDDSTIEYGSQIVIGEDFTEWTVADIARRTFNETIAFRFSDSWRIVEGTKHRKVATKTIASILIPSDRTTEGMLIGGAMGIGVGFGLGVSGYSSPFSNHDFLPLSILFVSLFGLGGIEIGAVAGAQHETIYLHTSESH